MNNNLKHGALLFLILGLLVSAIYFYKVRDREPLDRGQWDGVSIKVPTNEYYPPVITLVTNISDPNPMIWVTFEENDKAYMVGAIKALGRKSGPINQNHLECVAKVQNSLQTILYHACCTTNIQILSNYTGTIQFGTNFFRYRDIWVVDKPEVTEIP